MAAGGCDTLCAGLPGIMKRTVLLLLAAALVLSKGFSGALFTEANRMELRATWDGDGVALVAGEATPAGFLYYPGEPCDLALSIPADAAKSGAPFFLEAQRVHTRVVRKDPAVHIPTFGNPDILTLEGGPSRTGAFARDADVTRVRVPLGEAFGTYAVVLCRGAGADAADRHFLGTVARVPAPNDCADPLLAAPVLGEGQGQPFAEMGRMGVRIVRCEISWDGAPPAEYDWTRMDALHGALRAAGLQGLFVLGAVGPRAYSMPGVPEPVPGAVPPDWDGSYYLGNADWGCRPERFDDYAEWVGAFCRRYWNDGRGTLWGLENFNEPWEGGGISGYARDCVTYREWQRRLARAARAVSPGIRLCAASFIQDTEDKFYSEGPRRDGTYEADAYLDAYTDHYASLGGSYGPMVAKLHGKFSIENETWRAISDYQLPQLVCGSLASGQRAMAPWHGSVLFDRATPGGPLFPTTLAATTAVFNRFVGGLAFSRLVFPGHLPWLFQFGGDDDPDGVCLFFGQRLTGGGPTPDRRPQGRLWGQVDALPGGVIRIPNADGALRFHGADGNPVHAGEAEVVLPLDAQVVYIRAAGGPAAIERAFRSARIEGKCAVEILPLCFDRLPGEPGAQVRVELANRLDHVATGRLDVTTCGDLEIRKADNPATEIILAPGERRVVAFDLDRFAANPRNQYPCTFVFEGPDGRNEWSETLEATVARRRSPRIDGDLSDWEGIPGATLAGELANPDADELARTPWARMTREINAPAVVPRTGASFEELAATLPPHAIAGEVRLAWDRKALYVAARVRDTSPQADKVRMATRDDEGYFHSAASDSEEPWKSWLARVSPDGARSFAEVPHVYRRKPHDNAYTGDQLQLLFNLVEGYGDLAPATAVPWGFHAVPDTDYEFCAYLCADGRPELWNLLAPGMPRMHDWPRQPRGKRATNPTPGAKIAIRQEGDIRTYEIAIPRKILGLGPLKRGQTLKFGFLVHDDHGARAAFGEAKARCKDNGLTAHSYWRSTPACEVEWTLVD
jgi:hypothetical protein